MECVEVEATRRNSGERQFINKDGLWTTRTSALASDDGADNETAAEIHRRAL
jgi:hypothetical protein